MGNRKLAVWGAISACLFCFASGSMAAVDGGAESEDDEHKFYLGGTLGQARGEVGASEMNHRMASLGYDAQAVVSNQNRTAWGLFGGYKYSQYLDLEAGYIDLGEVRTKLSGSVADIQSYLNSATIVHPRSANGIELAIIGRYPLNERWGVYARGGLLYGKSQYHANAITDQASRSDTATEFIYGAGIDFQASERWDLRLAYNRYPIEDEKISAITFSLVYNFSCSKK